MTERIQCPDCGQQYPFKPGMAGKQARCKKCGRSFRIEAPSAVVHVQMDEDDDLKLQEEPAPTPVAAPQEAAPQPGAVPQGLESLWTPPKREPEKKQVNATLLRIAIFLAILGVGGFILPAFGRQFKIFADLGVGTPIAAAIVGLLGAVLAFLALRQFPRVAFAASAAIVAALGLGYAISPYGGGELPGAKGEPPDSAWRTFECPGGNFAAEFPGKPERVSDARLGSAVQYRTSNEFAGYFVTYDTLPAGRLTPTEVLDVAQAHVSGPPKRVVEAHDIALEGGHPGRMVVAKHSGKDVLYVWRGYIVNDKVYQTLVATSPDRRDASDVTRFLDSFHLLKPVGPTVAAKPRPKIEPPRPPKPRPEPPKPEPPWPEPPKPRPRPEPPKPEPRPEPPADADDVAKALFYLRKGDAGQQKRAAADLARRDPVEGRRKEVAEALIPLLSSEDIFTVGEALKALARWHTPESIPAMIQCTKHQSHGVRWPAFEALAQTKDKQGAEAIAECLATDRGIASKALIAMGSVAEEALLKRLEHGDQQVQAEACRILGEIGSEQTIEKLAALLGDENFFLRVAAARALRDRGAAAEDAVLKQLGSRDKQTVVEACKVLQHIGTDKSLPALRKLTRSRDFQVRTTATTAGRAIAARK